MCSGRAARLCFVGGSAESGQSMEMIISVHSEVFLLIYVIYLKNGSSIFQLNKGICA